MGVFHLGVIGVLTFQSSKQFGNTKVLKGLSFEVEKGDIFAFLGPNGSGKTTAIRILLGLLLEN